MAAKLDMSKTYDRIKWDFLEVMMDRRGFCRIWRQLVMQCVRIITSSIIVNGRMREIFYPTKGIQQGDPLFSYLFILHRGTYNAFKQCC